MLAEECMCMDAVVGGKWARGQRGYERHFALDVTGNWHAARVQDADERAWDS